MAGIPHNYVEVTDEGRKGFLGLPAHFTIKEIIMDRYLKMFGWSTLLLTTLYIGYHVIKAGIGYPW